MIDVPVRGVVIGLGSLEVVEIAFAAHSEPLGLAVLRTKSYLRVSSAGW